MTYKVVRSLSNSIMFGMNIETAPDGSVDLDLGFGVVTVNPKYLSFLELDPKVIEGQQAESYDEKFLKGVCISRDDSNV